MKKIIMYFIMNTILLTNAYSFNGGSAEIEKFKWEGVEVVWMNESSLPSYDVIFYFADGALGDQKNKAGETHLALNMIASGTRTYKKEEIADNLEYFGTSYGASIFHEYSTYRVSGLAKDMVPTVMKICHLFNDANFPSDELKKEQTRMTSALKQMIQSQDGLASRAFRMLSFKDTPFERPTDGVLQDIDHIRSSDLLSRLKFLTEKTYKKIYVNAPLKLAKEFENIILNNCRFKNVNNSFIREIKYSAKNKPTSKIHLVTVPKTNKAEVRIGRYLGADQLSESELAELSAGYLGGGFSARLMDELRKKRGLVYSVYAYSTFQKYYGRSVIATSTKNEQLVELIESTKNVIDDTIKGLIQEEDFLRMKNFIVGNYPFKFENAISYLNQLVFFDHLGKDYDHLNKFKSIVEGYNKDDVRRKIEALFKWNDQIVVILGDKDLASKLSKFGQVEIHSWESFL